MYGELTLESLFEFPENTEVIKDCKSIIEQSKSLIIAGDDGTGKRQSWTCLRCRFRCLFYQATIKRLIEQRHIMAGLNEMENLEIKAAKRFLGYIM